jgi:hypothetical protein
MYWFFWYQEWSLFDLSDFFGQMNDTFDDKISSYDISYILKFSRNISL